MMLHFTETVATVLFGLAILHTFMSSRLQHVAGMFRAGSVGRMVFHLLSEVELVFGFWAAVFILFFAGSEGFLGATQYLRQLDFTEPLFVLAIMTIAATRPVLSLANSMISAFARIIPLNHKSGIYFSCLALGPLFGSFITEPAAMAVVALILKRHFFEKSSSSERLRYLTLAVLFVNVSIGGALSYFAAPPVIMVASKWNWDSLFIIKTFGWKVIIAVFANTGVATWILRNELRADTTTSSQMSGSGPVKGLAQSEPVFQKSPAWLIGVHVLFLVLIIVFAHHVIIFLGIFLLFLGVAAVTKKNQDRLRLRESVLVTLFLSGLVVLGNPQSWWVEPLMSRLSDFQLFLCTAGLTGFVDNAALTYLGAQIPGLTESSKIALASGAIAAGGLTVIANAPNPVGYAILNEHFGPDGIHPVKLFLIALPPTVVAMACLWML